MRIVRLSDLVCGACGHQHETLEEMDEHTCPEEGQS